MPSNVYGCPSAGNSARLFETGSLLKKASVLPMLAGVPRPALRLYSGAVSYKAVLRTGEHRCYSRGAAWHAQRQRCAAPGPITKAPQNTVKLE